MKRKTEHPSTAVDDAATLTGTPETLPGGARRLKHLRPPKSFRNPHDGHQDRDDPNRPLSRQEWLVVWEYAVDFNKTAAMIRAGYSAHSARSNTTRLFNRPNVQAAIVRALEYRKGVCMCHADMVVGTLVNALEASVTDYVTWTATKITVRAPEEIPAEKLRYLAHFETTPLGGISIKLLDKMAIIDKLGRHLGLFDKEGRAKKKPHDLIVAKLQAVRDEKITATQAVLDLEMAGLAIPESLRLIATRNKADEGPPDDGTYSVVSEEEMAKRAACRRAQIEDQRNTFVPQRQAEVQALKDELGSGSFGPEEG